MFNKELFVNNLRKFRHEKGLTKKDVYEAMGCSQPAYSNYENEKSKRLPSIENLINLSETFGISIDALLGTNIQTKTSVSNILELLCDIFEIVPYRIEKTRLPIDGQYHYVPTPDSQEQPLYIDDRYAIYFDSHYYNAALGEMCSILSLRKNWDTMNKMLDLWRKDLVKQYGGMPANDSCSEDIF